MVLFKLITLIMLSMQTYSKTCCNDIDVPAPEPISQKIIEPIVNVLDKLNKDHAVTVNDIPWIGRLTSQNKKYACSAILVNDDLVLTARHCIEKLKKNPVFYWQQVGHTYKEKIKAKLHFKPDEGLFTHNLFQDDWAIYKLNQKLNIESQIKIKPSNEINLKDLTLISIGYSSENDSFYEVNKCKYIGKGAINTYSFVTNCKTKEGMSGGPILYMDESGDLYLIAIRSGPQNGLFIKNGTREIRSERFLPYIKR